jgi:hypothetical protein
MNTLQSSSEACGHERRHGTTVCLLCRAEARIAARERRTQLFVRSVSATILLAALGAAGTVGLNAYRGRTDAPRIARDIMSALPAAASAAPDSLSAAPAPTEVAAGPSAPGTATDSQSVQVVAHSATAPATPAAATTAPTAPVAPKAPIAPLLAEGKTVLPNGMVATRSDSVVTLAFDNPSSRTRQPEKFEQLLRTTLPKVYGPAIDSVLSKVPAGELMKDGNLVSDLPTRGIHVPVRDAWSLAVYPETRPGHDGPLVVRYRVSVVPRS